MTGWTSAGPGWVSVWPRRGVRPARHRLRAAPTVGPSLAVAVGGAGTGLLLLVAVLVLAGWR